IDFLEVKIIDTKFELNNSYEENVDKNVNYEIGFEPVFMINKEDPTDGLVEIKATFFDESFIEKNNPFYLEMKIRGHFKSKEDGEPLNKYLINCLNIMTPYIRSYVTTFTSLAGINPVTIPPINIYDLLDMAESEE